MDCIGRYENLITNIGENTFQEAAKGRDFKIFLKHPGYHITTIAQSYNDVPEGEMLALFSAAGYLEIAINMGSANGLLGMQLGDTIRIEFE